MCQQYEWNVLPNVEMNALCEYIYTREDWRLRGLRASYIWVPRNLSHHMDKQARIGDTVLVSNIEMTGRSQTLPWWLEREGVKTTGNKIYWPRWSIPTRMYKCYIEEYLLNMFTETTENINESKSLYFLINMCGGKHSGNKSGSKIVISSLLAFVVNPPDKWHFSLLLCAPMRI